MRSASVSSQNSAQELLCDKLDFIIRKKETFILGKNDEIHAFLSPYNTLSIFFATLSVFKALLTNKYEIYLHGTK